MTNGEHVPNLLQVCCVLFGNNSKNYDTVKFRHHQDLILEIHNEREQFLIELCKLESELQISLEAPGNGIVEYFQSKFGYVQSINLIGKILIQIYYTFPPIRAEIHALEPRSFGDHTRTEEINLEMLNKVFLANAKYRIC